MLRITEADGLSVGGSTRPERLDVVDLRDRRGRSRADARSRNGGDALLAEPARTLPAGDRAAVGRVTRLASHALDAVALGLPLLLSGFVNDVVSTGVAVIFVTVGTLLLWPTHRRGRHVVSPSEALLPIATRIGLAPVVTWGLLMVLRWSSDRSVDRFIDVVGILSILVFTVPLVLLGRVVSYRLSTASRRRGYDLEDTLVLGVGPTGVEIAEALQANPEVGLVPCGFVDRFEGDGSLPVVGRPEDLPEILVRTGVRNVVIAFGAASEEELVCIVRRCHHLDVKFFAVPRLFELGVSAGDVGYEVDGLPLVPVRCPGHSSQMWPAKRAFDVVAAASLLLVTAPVFAACALAVKLTSRGPVFFRQVRVGIGGRPFEILKFRTMSVNDDSNTQWSVDDDDRVTSVGRLLRPSHLDELPQLLNVLRGDMSLVGPRPERPHFVEQFSAEIDGYEYRHRVPVGITGWAQVNGFWGDTSIERRVRLDNRYIENWSLWRDLVIALRTVPTLLGRRR